MEAMMPTGVPSFLLKKLYVKGSFKNLPNGFEFTLRNTLAPSTLIGFGSLQIDGRDIPLDKLSITAGNAAPIRASAVSTVAPRAFPLNSAVTLRVEDQPLAPGSHRVSLAVKTKEAGELKIAAEDTIE
jgi:hydroxymethylglutaryl-CoA reductase (NADPH)